MHLNPVKKGRVKWREDWRWSSYNNFALDKATVAACPSQIEYVQLLWDITNEKSPPSENH
jgi:hypothetical protein